jgi:hypothetical protein
VVNDNAYELDLPPQMQIHPVLNVSRLKAYHDGRVAFPLRTRADTRPQPATTSSDGDEYEVESILAKRGKGARTEYLVRWKDWPIWEATWERQQNVAAAKQAVSEFEANLQRNDTQLQVNVLDGFRRDSAMRNVDHTIASIVGHHRRLQPPSRIQQTSQAPAAVSVRTPSPRTHTVLRARVSGIGYSVIRARQASRQTSVMDRQQKRTQQQYGNDTATARMATPPPVPASASLWNTVRTRPTMARRSGPMQPSPAQGCTMQLPRARPDHTGSRHDHEDLVDDECSCSTFQTLKL